MQDPLVGLNEQQRQVAQAVDGPVLVLAGAGSGKTKALTHRIAYLLHQGAAAPGQILAVTFTNKAAGEMRERVSGLVGRQMAPQAISTFHSLGVRLLREMEGCHPRSKRFVIADSGDSERLVRQAVKDLNMSTREWNPKHLKHQISDAKGSLLAPEDIAGSSTNQAQDVLAKVYARYEALLAKHDAYDFDDLLSRAVEALEQHQRWRDHYRAQWKFLSVDEYQDTNPLQYKLLHLVLNDDQNICVVGDDYQAIYSWRGAEVDHILRFEKQFPNCCTVYLTQNYRSTPQILEAANAIIAVNEVQKHKELWTQNNGGHDVRVAGWPTDRHEARAVREAVQQHLQDGGRLSDVAILYRTNAQSRVLEEEFLSHRIPYTIVGGFRFYERREIKDALAFLYLFVNPNSRMSFDRLAAALLKRVGPKTIDKWEQAAAAQGLALLDYVRTQGASRRDLYRLTQALANHRHESHETVADLLRGLLENSGYTAWLQEEADGEERLENIQELYTVTSAYDSVETFLEDAALLSDIDNLDDKQDRVLCMTLHAAKGLEFPTVFLVGAEDGLLPHINSFDKQAALEEERRLLYVGMTRAKQQLVISYAKQRFMGGELMPRLTSRFLDDLPEGVVRDDGWSAMDSEEATIDAEDPLRTILGGRREAAAGEPVMISVATGDFVLHPKLGRGVVIDIKGADVICVFEKSGVRTVHAGSLHDS